MFSFYPRIVIGQSKRDIITVIAKVVDMDGKGIFDRDFAFKTLKGLREYYYAIQHFKVVSPKGDTLLIAYVFDTKTQIRAAIENFGITKDSIYEFTLYKLNPCNSDFPVLIGCAYRGDSLYIPHAVSVVKKPYSKILRIIDLAPMDLELWKELCEYYKNVVH
jgi:hypothetical protein